jgi:hypothetical protein
MIQNAKQKTMRIFVAGGLIIFMALPAFAQYKPSPHRELAPGEIPVNGPGNYAGPGKTYVLTKDIVSDRSAVFLGKDVTLDLNGYTIRYADAGYGHIPNRGFEEGLKEWDVSRAPGAKVMNTADVHVFVGKKLLSLEAGDEITSSYVHLPVAGRSYIAMCGITGRHYHDPRMNGDLRNEMKVSVFVEDAQGREVRCETEYRDSAMLSSPVERRSPRLGGGFVYAHLTGLPAGKYRVRVRADTDCLVDEIDIRPAFDVGVGVVHETWARGHYDHLYQSLPSAFFDYTQNAVRGTPLPGIPVAEGRGSVTIRNGVIESGTIGAISWGIQSTAPDVRMVLTNLSIKTAGINAIAVDAPQATITSCRFDVDDPFLVSRHGSSFYAVDLRGEQASQVAYSEFYGGQGCLVFKGKHSDIHHNRFFNRQMVTNHYSIMAMGDSSRIFDNYIEPETGSGIEIYSRKYIDIFNNDIKITSSPPTCEYGHEEYSANAVRIADYRALPGAPNGAYGNRVYNNRIFIRAVNYERPAEYIPLSWAFFYSASGGDNDIFGNDIVIEHTAPGSKALAAAFFITGGSKGFGGNFYNNRITSNVPPIWIAGKYGGASRTRITGNTIIKSAGALPDYTPLMMGYEGCSDCIAKNVVISSNKIVNDTFAIRVAGGEHEYAVRWQLRLKVTDRKGAPLAEREVQILDKAGGTVLRQRTGARGELDCVLDQYAVNGDVKSSPAPYTIKVGNTVRSFYPVADTTLPIVLKK